MESQHLIISFTTKKSEIDLIFPCSVISIIIQIIFLEMQKLNYPLLFNLVYFDCQFWQLPLSLFPFVVLMPFLN